MQIRCSSCGAPLDVSEGGSTVACGYCGVTSQVGAAPVGRAPRDLPPTVRRAPLPPMRNVAFGVGALVVVGIVAWVATGGSDSVMREWYAPICLVDANGDGAMDVAGLSATPGSSSWAVTLVDGHSGDRAWTGESFASDGGLVMLCSDARWFGVDAPDFRARMYRADAPDEGPVLLPLPDRVGSYGFGTGCVRIDTRDGTTSAFGLPSGVPQAECAGALMRSPHVSSRFTDVDAGGRTVEAGSARWTLSARDRGTPFLSVRRDGEPSWEMPLRFTAPNGEALAMALAGDTLVVYAATPENDEVGAIVGLDPRTGVQRYAEQQGSTWSGDGFRDFAFNGELVLVAWGFGLHAYDPATGDRVWHMGGR